MEEKEMNTLILGILAVLGYLVLYMLFHFLRVYFGWIIDCAFPRKDGK